MIQIIRIGLQVSIWLTTELHGLLYTHFPFIRYTAINPIILKVTV